jgi:hypothetical protein
MVMYTSQDDHSHVPSLTSTSPSSPLHLVSYCLSLSMISYHSMIELLRHVTSAISASLVLPSRTNAALSMCNTCEGYCELLSIKHWHDSDVPIT